MSNFDRIAPYYDTLAGWVFGDQIRKSQTAFLHLIPKDGSVLVLGGGTGWILKDIILQCQPRQIVYVEPSGEMIRLAQKSIQQPDLSLTSVTFVQGTIANLNSEDRFDCLITPFVLDLFDAPELKKICTQLQGSLRIGGYWVFADFCIPNNWIRPFARILIRLMYAFFQLTSQVKTRQLADVGPCFPTAHFSEVQSAVFARGMITGKLYLKK